MPQSDVLKQLTLAACLVLTALLYNPGKAEAGPKETLIVAGGCFWCVEHDFEKVPGVLDAVSGFTGGSSSNPSYKEVTGGLSGHYEAVKITFDAGKISRERLLQMFFRSVDPTDAGGQFCDRGPSYRTAIFVNGTSEKALAESVKAEAQSALGQKIVTPVLNAGTFYPAEEYHQDYSKSSDIVLTRFGPRKKSKAYKLYRNACGRDQRVKELWGNEAAFAS